MSAAWNQRIPYERGYNYQVIFTTIEQERVEDESRIIRKEMYKEKSDRRKPRLTNRNQVFQRVRLREGRLHLWRMSKYSNVSYSGSEEEDGRSAILFILLFPVASDSCIKNGHRSIWKPKSSNTWSYKGTDVFQLFYIYLASDMMIDEQNRLSLYWCLWQNSLSKLIGFIQQKILHIQIMGQDHSQEKKTKLCVYILLIKLERNLKSLIIWAFHITPHTYLIHFRPWCYIPGVCWFINLSWKTIPFLFASLKEFSSSYV